MGQIQSGPQTEFAGLRAKSASSPGALIAFSCAKYCCVYDAGCRARPEHEREALPVRVPASRDIPRRTRNSISRKKKQSERLGMRLGQNSIWSPITIFKQQDEKQVDSATKC